MTAHKHAARMAEYAKDAQETDKPWERWQHRYLKDEWADADGPFAFFDDCEYRRKPKTININGHDVPEPVREPLENGREYWVADVSKYYPPNYDWYDDEYDAFRLKRGIIHLTKEAAQQHVDALLSFTRTDQ